MSRSDGGDAGPQSLDPGEADAIAEAVLSVENDAPACCVCGACALHLIATPASAATGQGFYCDAHAAELLARAYRPRVIPPAVTCGHMDPDGCGCDR